MATQTDSHRSHGTSPPIAALFLVVFDRKVGYSIAWKRSIPDVELEGVVEYKSLPSGLHNVESDLVYFVHDQHVGISAFVSQPADEAHRGANFAAVGVLVPLSHGKLGRSWLHAEELRDLAALTVDDTENTGPLDEYWAAHRIDDDDESDHAVIGESASAKKDDTSSQKERRKRAHSSATSTGPDVHTLPPDHPAMTLSSDLDTFGPLLFPLYRAALLRKRILVLTSPPIQRTCNFVYNLSVLSNIPPPLADVIRTEGSLFSSRPLFNVGIHDIANLSKEPDKDENDEGSDTAHDMQSGWIACSTDDILATKTKIYDILVELPQTAQDGNVARSWPKLRTSAGEQIKATQRDLRRYHTLRKEMDRVQRSRRAEEAYHDDDDDACDDNDESESAPLTRVDSERREEREEYVFAEGEASLTEPSSWASIAYEGFLWWASAGEKDALLEDEAAQDSSLLEELPFPKPSSRPSSRPGSSSRSIGKRVSTGSSDVIQHDEAQEVAMSVIAYAHRLTSLTFEALADMFQVTEDESEDGAEADQVMIESEDLRRMGLDAWSEADKAFVRELAMLYFEREVEVRGRSVECCGIKIC